ncbi:hypothetical protein [Gimesia maris]|uniref:hypothetical protein n=1 Tax=Gimesia maris TaxID=122 RepID=UPI0032ECC18D
MSLYDKVNHNIMKGLIGPRQETGLEAIISDLCTWEIKTERVEMPFTEFEISRATAAIKALCLSRRIARISWSTIQNALEGGLTESISLSDAESEAHRKELVKNLVQSLNEKHDGYHLLISVLYALELGYRLEDLKSIPLIKEDWAPPVEIRSICQIVLERWANLLEHADQYPIEVLEEIIPEEVRENADLMEQIIGRANLRNYMSDHEAENIPMQNTMLHGCCNCLSQAAQNQLVLQN